MAWAGLIGTQVTGAFTNQAQEAPNYFDPANAIIYHIPAAALNSAGLTVTIAPHAVEFGTAFACVSTPCPPGNLFWANFTDTQLDIHNTAAFSYSDNFYFQFTDPAFSGITLSSSDWLTASLTYSISGDTIYVDLMGVSATSGQNYDAIFDVASTAPEPSTVLLIAVGCAGMALSRLRRTLQ